MAVHTLFQSAEAGNPSEAMVALTDDIGRLPRERRLALYFGACRALGLDVEKKPLRYIRCDDGALRLSIAANVADSLRGRLREGRALSLLTHDRPEASRTLDHGRKPRRVRLTLLRGDARSVVAGGITYDIDLSSGELAVDGVLRGKDDAKGYPEGHAMSGYDRMAG